MTSTEKVGVGDFLLLRMDDWSPVLTHVQVMKKIGDEILQVMKLSDGDEHVYIEVRATEIFNEKGVEL